jgi:hypothetical protein
MGAHSKFGASSFARVIACNGSIRQAKDCINTTNPAAEQGTAAHELGEFCLHLGVNAFDCLGMKFNGFTVDAEMADAVQLYVSFIRDIALKNNVDPKIEVRVVMLSVGEHVFGTADCIFIIVDTIHVYDYKHGYGIVEVENNAQAIFYGVATLDTLNIWDKINHVVTGIIQPRADHIAGSIRLHSYSIQEMREWQLVFKKTVRLASDPNAELNAGEHCTYCLASDFCRPRMERTMQLAYGEKPFDTLNEEEIIVMFREIRTIKRNLDRIEERALELVRAGKQIKGFKLVRGIQRANCENETGFVEAVENLKDSEIKKDDLYNTNVKLKSMTDCKRILNHSLVNQYFIKPPMKTTLVKMTDKRPAISTANSIIGKFKSVDHSGVIGKFKNRTE